LVDASYTRERHAGQSQASLAKQPAHKARAFDEARRHSARVRVMRRYIPIGAGISILTIVVIGLFDPFRSIGGISVGPINLSGTKLTMEQPRLTGFRSKDAKPYEVTADSASQDIRKPNIVEMKGLKARITMEGNGAARLTSDTGIYDTQKENMDLRSNVRLITDTGYDAKLKSAFIDFKGGNMITREPVKVDFKGGSIESERLDVTDNGKRFSFEGRVRAEFEAGDAPAPGPAKGKP
jgi:lipopolysaccharide export system protein LptC